MTIQLQGLKNDMPKPKSTTRLTKPAQIMNEVRFPINTQYDNFSSLIMKEFCETIHAKRRFSAAFARVHKLLHTLD